MTSAQEREMEARVCELEYELLRVNEIVFALARGVPIGCLSPFGQVYVQWLTAMHAGRAPRPG